MIKLERPKKRIRINEVYNEEELNELARQLARAAAIVKLVCGVANNAAWLVMGEAMSYLKASPLYRHEAKHAFKLASQEIHSYENTLLTSRKNRMFHVADMSPDVRRKYRDGLTDREYYDFWKTIGGTAYNKTHPLVTSLQNKFRLSLIQHGVKNAVVIAWAMTAQAALNIAVEMYHRSIAQCYADYNISKAILNEVFGQFCLQSVADKWSRALMTLEPETTSYKLDSVEDRNIEMGIEQLVEAWGDATTLYRSMSETAGDTPEIFATKGYMKRSQAVIHDLEVETKRNMAQSHNN